MRERRWTRRNEPGQRESLGSDKERSVGSASKIYCYPALATAIGDRQGRGGNHSSVVEARRISRKPRPEREALLLAA
jgi:hypothetical protein